MELKDLSVFAEEIRLETIREIGNYGSGHVGGAMSIVEILAALYGRTMRYDPKDPAMADRDWLVLSKGHAAPALYATLALLGFFPKERLATLNQSGTTLPSHSDRKCPGVDMTTGSLGQGASCALGIAEANRLDGRDNYTYLIVGDGEIDEGQVWEAAMYAAAKKLDHFVVIVDWNKKQLDGRTVDILDSGDLAAKFEAFGFNVKKVDGHNAEEIADAFAEFRTVKGKPSMLLADTVKGYGCLNVETAESNHHAVLNGENLEAALAYAEKRLDAAKAGKPMGRIEK